MNRTKSIITGSMFGLGLLLAAGQPAQAVQAVWDNTFTPSGWTRGSTPGSHYAEWNIFNDDIPGGNIQDTSPEVSLFGGGAYQVAETTGAAFLTSGGNIYSPSAPTAFNFTAGGLGAGTTDVYLRVGSLGNFDSTLMRSFTNFTLNGVAGTYQQLHNEVITGGFGGNEVEALVSWLGVSHSGSLSLAWNAVGSSVSLDQLSLDVGTVAPVPLPAAAYLMVSGIAGIVALARRRQRAV
ncbi:MAG: VPLPA-CTERM sorting domain-containing protein [Nitrospira sp.]|nr:VPLPA-CTERM sorting domain-containing protein [Nitrospira sp.]